MRPRAREQLNHQRTRVSMCRAVHAKGTAVGGQGFLFVCRARRESCPRSSNRIEVPRPRPSRLRQLRQAIRSDDGPRRARRRSRCRMPERRPAIRRARSNVVDRIVGPPGVELCACARSRSTGAMTRLSPRRDAPAPARTRRSLAGAGCVPPAHGRARFEDRCCCRHLCPRLLVVGGERRPSRSCVEGDVAESLGAARAAPERPGCASSALLEELPRCSRGWSNALDVRPSR